MSSDAVFLVIARLVPCALVACTLGGCTEDWDFTFGDPPPITCGGDECDVATELCCVDEMGENPSCRASCEAPGFTIACSQPAHCPGEACCASTTDFDGSACKVSCMGTDADVCSGTENTCEEGLTCAPNDGGGGVFVCIE